MLYRRIRTQTEQVSDRKFRFIISDESVDRYGTVLLIDGWQLDNYASNPIVAYQHLTWSSDPDLIVGVGNVWVEDKKLYADADLEPAGDNPLADKLAKKLAFGSIRATSVGFDPLEWSFGLKERGEDPDILYFRKSDLLEFSIVNIPANANAVVQKSFDDFMEGAKKTARLLNRKEEEDPPPPPPSKPVGPDPYRTKFLNQIFKSVS